MREPWLLIVGSLLACGGTEHEPSAERREPSGTAGPPGAGEPTPASQSGSFLADLDDEAAPEEARSFLDLWTIGARSMSTRFVHYHQPATGEVPAMICFLYSARDSAGNLVALEWPYEGREVSYDYANLTVAPSYFYFQNDPTLRQWRVVEGEVVLLPQAEGRARVELRGARVEVLGDEASPPEPIPDGFVTGEVERVCIEYVILEGAPLNDGRPVPQPQRDDDWSSEFCSRFVL